MSDEAILLYTNAAPFRPFRIQMVSGRTYDVHHPEMIQVTKRYLKVFLFVSDVPDVDDEWITLGLLVVESISHLEQASSSSHNGN